ncbi:MAG: FMN-binding protein [Opitutaceae bacterium]|nr:FMN-binding protein [Opitutaceae bacterium]
MKQAALQLYRLAVIAVIAWLIRDLAVRQRTHGDSPIAVDEVKKLLPDAASLRPDSSERDGLFVLDRQGRELGYVVRTQPYCRDIIGYCGVTDALVVLGPDWKILGITVHASDDTKEHVHDVVTDRRFLKKWNGMTWDTAAGLDLKRAGIEGVSGATMTSMAIARGVKARLQLSSGEIAARPPLQFGWRDWGLLAVLALGTVMAFGRPEWRQRWRRPFQVGIIIYVGFISGDMVTQQLLAGWSRAGIPWSTAPGLVLLTVAALLVPWATRKPIYCHQLCPHGAAQELIGKLRPARLQVTLSAGVGRGLEFLPAGLLLLVVVVAMMAVPLDLAGIEPFDAYLVRTAGLATIGVALVGLVASFFVPQAYCRFGCPTGALLNFVRARGPTDHFSRRDAAALGLVAVAVLINWQYVSLIHWVKGVP